ncbi:MAG: diguanylate cyclase, partial [Rubrivivax sp.]|nr:diguanylate cyclase [Rubrivivax sp.]
VWHGELFNRKKNGELYWESATISPVRDPAGHITHFVAVKNDITARKQTEEALKQSEAKYRLLAETSTDVIWTINEAQQFTYISPAILQLRGLTPEEAMRETMTESVCPEFLPRIAESFQKSAEFRKAGGTDFVDHMEIQQPHKDGSRVWVEIITRELYDHKGERIGALGISRNITARKQAEAALREYTKQLEELQAQLREQAIRDPLTGAFNRRYLMETLERELARAARDHDPLSLVMIDLDHFKVVNDTYGHLAGDWALQYLVQLIERKTRKSDIVCRYGGEEFVVLLPQTSLADAMRRAEEWRAALQNSPAQFSNETIAFTISMGVASNNPLELTSDRLLSLADQALYAAKQGGRNRVAALSGATG